jgi:hypothetical protein
MTAGKLHLSFTSKTMVLIIRYSVVLTELNV